MRSNQRVAWTSATREEALQQAPLVEASAADHDRDPRSPAGLRVRGNGSACRVKPVVEGEWVTRFSNIDAGVRPRSSSLCTDLVSADVKPAKHLARVCRDQY